MKVFAKSGNTSLATVYLASNKEGKSFEFVESLQPPFPKEKKWVLLVSSLFGCPVQCRFCDAGTDYEGKPDVNEIFFQVDYLVRKYFPDKRIPIDKWKIQFARMGEPAFNEAVLEVLSQLPFRYDAPGLLPSLSTVAPAGCEKFFQQLQVINRNLYRGRFQLQFSLHSTDATRRDWLIPVKKWDFKQIADFGREFFVPGGRKVTLNFALGRDTVLEPAVLSEYFDPDIFLVKLTPVNPTLVAENNALASTITSPQPPRKIIDLLQEEGYQVIYSFGEWEENRIGSNCGQYLSRYLKEKTTSSEAYTYPVEDELL